MQKPVPASAYGDDREKVTIMAGSAFRMYLFSRLRNLLLLLHICFQTLAGKKKHSRRSSSLHSQGQGVFAVLKLAEDAVSTSSSQEQ